MGSSNLIQTIKAVFEDQNLAVLSTRDGDQPYSNLVCFAATDDLRYLIFATTRATRKYANIGGGKLRWRCSSIIEPMKRQTPTRQRL